MNKKMFRIILPVAVLALGVLSAFGSQPKASSEGTIANELGWFHTSPDELCQSATDCSTSLGDICTINMIPGAQQLYRKAGPKNCELVLYRPL